MRRDICKEREKERRNEMTEKGRKEIIGEGKRRRGRV
jgi:hypothetical protein